MKKLIMFVMILAIAIPAMALKYPDAAPDFTGCDNSAWCIWEFTEPGCDPTSDEFYPPYGYFPYPAGNLTFGGDHYNNPFDGWGRPDYGNPRGPEATWVWSDGKYNVYSEDSFSQPIPERGGKKYLRQYFQVVHNVDPASPPNEDPSLLGLALAIWELDEWAGCPEGHRGIGTGIGGVEFPPPAQTISHGDGFFTSIWISDFSPDDSIETEYALNPSGGGVRVYPELYDATHTTCGVGMADFGLADFVVEEVILDFIWFDEPDGTDVPTAACSERTGTRRIKVSPPKFAVWEPVDIGGPPADPCEPTSADLSFSLLYQPGDPCYPDFNCTVVIDPNQESESGGSSDFTFTNPVPPDPNGNVTLIFTQDNWNIPQAVTVAATQDSLREGDEGKAIELTITIDIDDPNFGSDEPVIQGVGFIVGDNDIPEIMVLDKGNIRNTLTENDPCVPKCINVRLSHLPVSDVYVYIERDSDFPILFESMSVMDPPLGVGDDPNKLTFTTGNYSSPQTICLEARDDDIRGGGPEEARLEWVPGEILFNTLSDDPRYQSVEEGGELDETSIPFNVQDNECGAWGYNPLDLNGDCAVTLADFVNLYEQWLMCTYQDGRTGTGVAEFVDCEPIWGLEEEE